MNLYSTTRGRENTLSKGRGCRDEFFQKRRILSLSKGLVKNGLLVTIFVNFVVFLIVHRPDAAAPVFLPQLSIPRDTKLPCPDYGCPIYPAELTPYLNRWLDDLFVHENRTGNFSFGSATYGLLTRTGKSHFVNQDRAVLIKPFVTKFTPPHEPSFLLGIFDGHGKEGHIVADHVARDLPDRLAKALNSPSLASMKDDAIIAVLKKTFVDVDIYGPPNFLLGGCTASVALRIGSKLFIANAGDSQTILVTVPDDTTLQLNSPEDTRIAFTTRKDKAILPDEYERITELNGTIHINPKTNDSRVIVRSVAARDQIGLAMSRSLGDWEWKPVGVTAEPLVNYIDLKNYSNAFVITGSDGIWDVRRREFYAKQFSESFFRGDKPPLYKCWEVLRKITPKIQKGYRDDQTVAVIRI